MIQKNKVSVIVPVYNVQDYISECIESILSQTYMNIEIIIVDDGSTDNSINICRELLKKNSSCKIISQQNGGLSAARNTGLVNATGDFVFFLDGDDWIESDAIEKMIKDYLSQPCDIVSTTFYRDYPNKRISYETDELIYVNSSVCIEKMLFNEGINHSACGKLFRKEMFDGIRFPIGKYYEDYFTIYYIVATAKKICIDGYASYHYRLRDNSIQTGDMNLEQKINDFLTASNEVLDFVSLKYSDLARVCYDRKYVDYLQMYFMLRNSANKNLKNRIKKEIRKMYFEEKKYKIERKHTKNMVRLFMISPTLFCVIKSTYGKRRVN